MVKRIATACTIVLLLAFISPVSAQKSKQNSSAAAKTNIRFLDDIEIKMTDAAPEQLVKTETAPPANSEPQFINKKDMSAAAIETASSLQFKYSILLDTEVEEVQNTSLFTKIDEWYGTRYVLGGTTKKGVDCSAFVQVIYAAVLGISLPRTAREQHRATRTVAKDELREGDLVFFNTRGGVSHVGLYLQNNKFVHAATSSGVMISDLDESYWAKRFISAGRYSRPEPAVVLASKP